MPERLNLEKEIIVFIGPEGAGKSEMSKMLSTSSGKPRVSIGDILRDLSKNDQTHIGEACRKMFADHGYLEPNLLLEIQEKYFKDKKELKSGMILDGGLRTTTETRGFPNVLWSADLNLPITVLNLTIPFEESIKRLVEEGGRKRDDDTYEGVTSRLRNFYHKLDERLASIYRIATLICVDATNSKEETFKEICEALTKRNN